MSNVQTSISNLDLHKSDFTYKELKKQCILRGLGFEEATESSFFSLSSWLVEHRFNDIDTDRLYKYDQWVETILHDRGSDYLIHNSLRLSYVRDENDQIAEGEKKIKKLKVVKKKREKGEDGLVKGTMKSYTYYLTKKGKKIELIVKRVTKRFPDAKEKSIKIWHRKAKKENA